MGRIGKVDDATTQYHQGLEFEEFHQNQAAPDTIAEAPPHEDDLYEPPPKYNLQNKSKLPPTSDQPHAFPPPPPQKQDLHHDQPHAFPPVHDDEHFSTAQQFPPVNDDEHFSTAQQFPPVYNNDQFSTAQQFPLPPEIHTNTNNNPQFFSAQAAFTSASPVGGGIHTGMSPAPFTPHIQIPNHEWKTHLFDCISDPQNAIITLCFPCVTFGQIAEILDSGRTSCGTSGMLYVLISCCIAMPCLMTCSYRSKMRAKFGLIESPAPDCIVHCFCEYCALCQEYRELQQRGIDPSIGYYGNVAKMQKQQQQLLAMGMAAPVQQRMI